MNLLALDSTARKRSVSPGTASFIFYLLFNDTKTYFRHDYKRRASCDYRQMQQEKEDARR